MRRGQKLIVFLAIFSVPIATTIMAATTLSHNDFDTTNISFTAIRDVFPNLDIYRKSVVVKLMADHCDSDGIKPMNENIMMSSHSIYVPEEPPTIVLVGIGLIGLAAYYRITRKWK